MRLSIMIQAILASFVLFISISGHASNADPHLWKWYTNNRYQYTICYPEDLLIPQGESPNNDGQKFLARDGAQLLVFGGFDESLKDEALTKALAYTEARLTGPSGEVTYKVVKPSWFVISGYNGQRIFYATTRYNGDQFKSLELTYARSAAEVYEPLIPRLTTCFADLAQ